VSDDVDKQRPPPEPQTASAVLMVRPAAFSRNEVTRPSNRFQSADAVADAEQLVKTALLEFDHLVTRLKRHSIDVQVFDGRTTTQLPDEVFVNNWLTTHANGTIVLYPIMAWNRRPERRRDLIDDLQQRSEGFRIDQIIDLSHLEDAGQFLEGSGSLVLDRANRIGYACLSPRTHVEALKEFARRLDYGVVTFDARDRDGHAIYHTNVMMSLGERFAVVCLEAIVETEERFRVLKRLELTGRAVIEISLEQMHSFAGNLLELKSPNGNIIVLSTRAAKALTRPQKDMLRRHAKLVTSSLNAIETFGGGSARCMLAEIFLEKKPRTQ
jgi:hypothetical protein